MLENITFSFPKNAEGQEFFDYLTQVLRAVPNATFAPPTITLTALQPAQSSPTTIFTLANVALPQVQFNIEGQPVPGLGNFLTSSMQESARQHPVSLAKTLQHDALGSYCVVEASGQSLFRLPMAELCGRLKNHIVRIDHTGVNLPSAQISPGEWQQRLSNLAHVANLYRYPTGEDWPFILPATAAEFEADITHFPVGREPKFELVYDTLSPVPTIQIDLETDLTRSEIEQLFPQPYGVSFPDVADYFRTVYVDHPWPGLDIRFDLRFKNNQPDGDWETGKWLVMDDGRIR